MYVCMFVYVLCMFMQYVHEMVEPLSSGIDWSAALSGSCLES